MKAKAIGYLIILGSLVDMALGVYYDSNFSTINGVIMIVLAAIYFRRLQAE